MFAMAINTSAECADVVARPVVTASNVRSAPRTNAAASRMPTIIAATMPAPQPATETPEETVTNNTADPVIVDEPVIIEDKTSQFDSALDTGAASANDETSNKLADMIQQQRAALDAAIGATTGTTAASSNDCDSGLRACMTETCGANFAKCAGDGDTAWGQKMDLCRMKLKCTGTEYNALAPEIKADRDMYAKIASYTEIVNCGNAYNNCVIAECGATFNKCLGKSAGDAAIAKCKSVADKCKAMDSGLASRVMNVFGTLRQGAEVQVKSDEQRLYALRDEMRAACGRLGAMFDERTLDCVFTVNFWAANNDTPYASQKRYAGDTFDCTQDWFGVDITTFKENAYRETRAQKSASSAMLGAGVGTAVGAISSGALDRAIDRSKAEKALKNAEKEYEENYGTPDETDTSQGQNTETADNGGNTKTTNDTTTTETTKPTDNEKKPGAAPKKPTQAKKDVEKEHDNGTKQSGKKVDVVKTLNDNGKVVKEASAVINKVTNAIK